MTVMFNVVEKSPRQLRPVALRVGGFMAEPRI